MLRSYGVEVKGKLFDTMIAHYLIQPEFRHGMDYLAEIYLKYKTISYEELCGAKGKNQLSIRSVPLDRLCEYAAEDADVTLKLKNIFEKKLAENNLNTLFYDIEPLIRQENTAFVCNHRRLRSAPAKHHHQIQFRLGLK